MAWIVFCVFCNCIGWILSGLHALNRTGYSIAFLLGFALLVFCWKKGVVAAPQFPRWSRLRKRFTRSFPLAFLILAVLALIGGILYPPTNYDALAYRTPRVLHWLAEGQWHWIHTDFQRLNTRGPATEWVTAPLFLFTGTDRAEFLINAISFLLLPGLVFGILRELGVQRRTAWFWMWLLPSGYGYVLQAGSISNDLFGATLSMMAFFFALRAKANASACDVCLSFLAAGLMTSGKAFNLLLLLPWAIAVFPSLRFLLSRPALSLLCAAATALVSLIPMAVINYRACGDWTGLKLEQPLIGGASPVFRIEVNAALLLLNHFSPPVFPITSSWNHFIESTVPRSLFQKLEANFEESAAHFKIGELQIEETAGLGLGLSVLLVWLFIHRIKWRELNLISFRSALMKQWFWISMTAWFGVLVFMSKSGLYCPARYLAPFYVLLIVPVLRGHSASVLTRKPAWIKSCLWVFLLAAVPLIASPPRPLWPASTVLKAFHAETSGNPVLSRAWRVYSVYGARSDAFEPVKTSLPPGASPLGLVTFDDPETSLWKPFGSRRILHVRHNDSLEATRARGIRYILVSCFALTDNFGTPVSDWIARNNAEIVQRFQLDLRAGRGPTEWLLVKIH